MTIVCPRCKGAALDAARGVIGEVVCATCAGRFLPPESSERLLVEELGLEREALLEIATLFSGLRVPCPGCSTLMRPLRLRGVPVDLCFGCGGLWLDADELTRLSGGRYVEGSARRVALSARAALQRRGEPVGEPGPAQPPAVVVGRDADNAVSLGRGSWCVVFDSLDDVAVTTLQRAFGRTDGLTEIDAQLLARHSHGVVVDGVSRAGADGLAALLAADGVSCSVIADSVLRMPPALQTSNIVDVDSARITARLHTGPPLVIPWSEVAAVVAGVVRRERLEPVPGLVPSVLARSIPNSRGNLAPEPVRHEMVTSDDVVVELLQVGAVPRRLRVVTSPRPDQEGQQRRVCDVAARVTAVGRGPASPTWPRYRRPRELERELAWVAWRAARWPVER